MDLVLLGTLALLLGILVTVWVARATADLLLRGLKLASRPLAR
jgi:hypothetical protein